MMGVCDWMFDGLLMDFRSRGMVGDNRWDGEHSNYSGTRMGGIGHTVTIFGTRMGG